MINIRHCLAIMLSLWGPFNALIGSDTISGPDSGDTIRLEEVAVSVLPFNQSYKESAGAVFMLTPGSIDLKHMVTNTELLNLVPGVYMASGTYNTNRLVIRGIGSRTPYNTNRIRAYLDDIPLTSGDGVSTLEDQDRNGIGRLEILKGPASSLYGSGLGGVVRLTSPYPGSNGFTGRIFGELGSFKTGLYGATAGFKNERIAFSGGITNSSSEGYRENSRYGRTNAFMSMRLFGASHTLSLTLSMTDLFARIPSSLNEADYQNEPWKAGGSWAAVKGFEEYFRLLGGVSVESKPGKGITNKLVLFATMNDPYESRPFNILDDRATNVGFREVLTFQFSSWKISTGVEYFHEWVDWKVYETNGGIQGELLTDQGEVRKQVNAFSMMQWRPSEKILVDGGINANILAYSLSTNFRADSTDQSGSYRYKPVFSPRLGMSYQHHSHHHFYTSAGHGFSAPSLEETLLPEGTVNSALKPETGWNVEVGNRGDFYNRKILYDATLYSVILDNLLVTERIAEDIFMGANAGRAINTGLELYTKIYIMQPEEQRDYDITTTLSYTLSHNRFIDFVDEGISYSGNSLPGIPSQVLNAIVSARWDPVEVKLHLLHLGRQWMNDLNSLKYDGHTLLNIQAGWKIPIQSSPCQIELHGGIRNVLNTQYSSMILVNAPSFGGNTPRYYYPGNPRQFHLGASFQFR